MNPSLSKFYSRKSNETRMHFITLHVLFPFFLTKQFIEVINTKKRLQLKFCQGGSNLIAYLSALIFHFLFFLFHISNFFNWSLLLSWVSFPSPQLRRAPPLKLFGQYLILPLGHHRFVQIQMKRKRWRTATTQNLSHSVFLSLTSSFLFSNWKTGKIKEKKEEGGRFSGEGGQGSRRQHEL